MKITISSPINGMGIDSDEHLLDESGKPLVFESVNEALQFFADRNCTITDLLGFDFHVEEEPEENHCLSSEITGVKNEGNPRRSA